MLLNREYYEAIDRSFLIVRLCKKSRVWQNFHLLKVILVLRACIRLTSEYVELRASG